MTPQRVKRRRPSSASPRSDEQVEDDHIEALNEELQERVEEASGLRQKPRMKAAKPSETKWTTATWTPPTSSHRRGLISFEDFEGVHMRVGEFAAPSRSRARTSSCAWKSISATRSDRSSPACDSSTTPRSFPERALSSLQTGDAELFGIESNGMVLAAGDEADLLTTHEDAPLGTRIK